MINGSTILTGLLGRPVSHSISPAMHNTAFEALNLNYAYLCFDIGEAELARAVEALKLLGARGWNCTMPNKNLMAGMCDKLSPAAEIIGAVNTVVNDNGVLTGCNTDGIGYMQSVSEAGHNIIGEKITVLGAGGASTSIFVQAALDGVREISVFSRPGKFFERAKNIFSKLSKHTSCKLCIYDYSDPEVLRRELKDSRLLVNGTSVGMAPKTDDCPINDASMLHPDLIVSDVIYNPRKTRLLETAEQVGCSTFNGLDMLLYQGAEAFWLWTGKRMPIEAVREKCFKQ